MKKPRGPKIIGLYTDSILLIMLEFAVIWVDLKEFVIGIRDIQLNSKYMLIMMIYNYTNNSLNRSFLGS